MPTKSSSAKKNQNRQLRSGCGESLQSSLQDEFIRNTEKVARQDSLKISDKDVSQRTLDGKQNYSDE